MPKTIALLLKYAMLIVVGIALILFASMLQTVTAPSPGEYYYSDFLRNNYTLLAGGLFFGAGILIGFFLKLNPWLAGIALIAALPLASFYEASVYKGSHNLIPFELIIYFLFSVPAITGVYIGRYFSLRRNKQKEQTDKPKSATENDPAG
jgi:hypothetical protein